MLLSFRPLRAWQLLAGLLNVASSLLTPVLAIAVAFQSLRQSPLAVRGVAVQLCLFFVRAVENMLSPYVRWGFAFFFATHLFITLLLDVQALPIGNNFPEALKALIKFHVETNHDYFMSKPTIPWFEALVWLELLFHVPFFAFATAGFVRRWNAVRIPCIIYGTSAATSVVPIIADVLASDKLTDPQRYKLVGIYLPWFILPLVLTLVMAADPTPFGAGARYPMEAKRQ